MWNGVASVERVGSFRDLHRAERDSDGNDHADGDFGCRWDEIGSCGHYVGGGGDCVGDSWHRKPCNGRPDANFRGERNE